MTLFLVILIQANVSIKKLAVDVHGSTPEKIDDSEIENGEFLGSKQEVAAGNDCNERVSASSGLPERRDSASGEELQETCTTVQIDNFEESSVTQSGGHERSKIIAEEDIKGKAVTQDDDQKESIGSGAELKTVSSKNPLGVTAIFKNDLKSCMYDTRRRKHLFRISFRTNGEGSKVVCQIACHVTFNLLTCRAEVGERLKYGKNLCRVNIFLIPLWLCLIDIKAKFSFKSEGVA